VLNYAFGLVEMRDFVRFVYWIKVVELRSEEVTLLWKKDTWKPYKVILWLIILLFLILWKSKENVLLAEILLLVSIRKIRVFDYIITKIFKTEGKFILSQ